MKAGCLSRFFYRMINEQPVFSQNDFGGVKETDEDASRSGFCTVKQKRVKHYRHWSKVFSLNGAAFLLVFPDRRAYAPVKVL